MNYPPELGIIVPRRGKGRMVQFLIFWGSRTAVLLLVTVASAFAGNTYRVTVGASGSGNGSSWATPMTLQQALATAVSGDEIWVAAGTYRPTTNTDRTISFRPAAGVIIYGGFAGNEQASSQRSISRNPTILSGDIGTLNATSDNTYNVIIPGNGVILDGFTIRDGNANASGTGPQSGGGGMYLSGTSPVVRNCVFVSNNALYAGGAIFCQQSTTATFENCVFTGNTAATGYGGAVEAEYAGANPSFNDCIFSGNVGLYGTAIETASSPSVTIANCIIWGNSGGTYSIYNNGGSSTTKNSIVQGSGGVSWTGGVYGASDGGNLDVDPRFANAGTPSGNDGIWMTADDGFRLQSSSPAISAGVAAGNLTADILGRSRPIGSGYDMGPYEYYPVIFCAPGGAGTQDGTSFANGMGLVQALTAAVSENEIWIKAGTYKPTTTSTRTTSFILKPSVAIYGGFSGWETRRDQRDWRGNPSILSGDIGTAGTATDNSYHVVLGAANATLDGLVIRDGRADGTSPDNNGGGLATQGNPMSINNCRFVANHASNYGAGIYVSGTTNSNVQVDNTVFESNTATLGAGFMSYIGTATHTVRNSVFINNTATDHGGAFHVNHTTTWINDTFYGNTAVNGTLASYGGTQTVQNCIVWGNTGTNPAMYGSSTFAVTYSTVQGGYAGTGNLSVDPQFSATADLDGPDNCWGTGDDGLIPQAGSPVVNAGSATSAPFTDLRGAPRTSTVVDMGAYERNARWYVDANGTGDGTSWGNALNQLGAACAVAGAGDDIWIKAGTYFPTSSADSSATFMVPTNGGLWGGFAGTETNRIQRNPATNRTILSGDIGVRGVNTDNSLHVVTMSTNGSIDGCIIQDGNATTGPGTAGGGGILINDVGGTSVSNCIIQGNTSTSGGAGMLLYNSSATAIDFTVTNCLLANNTTGSWGAAFMTWGATSGSFINCTMANNSVATYGAGGAVYGSGNNSAVTMRNCIIYGNTSQYPFCNFDGSSSAVTLVSALLEGGLGAQYGPYTDSGVFSGDPGLNNVTNPMGPDGQWFTDDDGCFPGFGGPAVNVSGLTGVPTLDLMGRSHTQMSISDLGCYEVPNTVSISATDSAAAEAGPDTGTIKVIRSGPTTVPQVVYLTVAGSSTASSTDFILPATVTIPVGANSAIATITPVDDLVREDAETVVVQIANFTTATVTITSDDVVGVLVSTSALSVTEAAAGSAGTFTVRLNSQPTAPVTVALTSGNTGEYVVSPASLTFQPDPSALTAQTVTVTAVNDATDDGNQVSNLTFAVTSSDATYQGRSVAPVAVTTVDDDARGLILPVTSVAVSEGGSSTSFTVALASQPLNLGLGSNVSVAITSSPAGQVTLSGGSSASLTFTTGNWNSPQTVTVAAMNDDQDENSPQAVVLSLVGSGGDYGGVTGSVTANVTDDDATPTLAIANTSVSEGAGSATVSITMTGKSAGSVSVPYATAAGTATNGSTTLGAAVNASSTSVSVASATGITAGMIAVVDSETVQISAVSGTTLTVVRGALATTATSHGLGATFRFGDFATASGTLTWAAGETGAKTFSVAIGKDALNEDSETLSIGFSGVTVTGAPSLATTSGTATLTITDDDAVPTVQFTNLAGAGLASQSTTEGDSGSVVLTLYATLSAPSGKAVSVPFGLSGTAGSGSDYTCTASPLSFAVGTTQMAIQVSILGDTLNEDNETVVLTMGAPTGATANGVTTHTVTIQNNDAVPSLTIAATSSSINEAGSTTYTVTKSHASQQVVTATVSVSGTATQNADFTLSSTSVSIPSGSTSATLTLTGLTDVLYEGNETVSLSLASPTNASLGTTTTATVTLQDDDAVPSVSLEASKSVAESIGSTTVTATLSAVSGLSTTVPFTVSGTATGADYSITASPIIIPAGSTTAAIIVSITNDDLDESNETVLLAIGSPTNATKAGSDHTLTITDDDNTPTLAVSGLSVTEPGDNSETTVVNVPVTLTGKSASSVTVSWATGGGTASAGADYTAASGTLTWSAGTTGTQTVPITILSDNTAEPNETITVTLSAPASATLSTSTATVTINDDDSPGLNISTFAAAVTEGGAESTVNLVLNTVPSSTVTISVSADAEMEVSLDGASWGASVPFTASSVTATTIHLQAKDDAIYEGIHTGVVSISAASSDGNYNGLSGTITATITDDEAVPSIGFTSATATTAETGTVSLGVSLNRASDFPTTVSYATSNDSATAVADYTASSGSLIIPAGQTTGSIGVIILTDTNDEPDEAFTVTLSNPVNGTLGTATATVTITDDDAPSAVAFQTGGIDGWNGAMAQTVAENATGVSATVALSAMSGWTVTVDYTIGGTATAGQDFLLDAGTLTYPAGTTTATIPIPLQDDSIVENAETVVLTLANPVHATLGAIATATLTLTDGDSGGITLSGTAGLSVTEGGASTSYGVALTAAPSTNVTVTITPSAQVTVDTDAATVGAQTTLTFTPANWAQPQAVVVTAVDDLYVETSPMTVTVSHAVTAGPGAYPSAATVNVSLDVIDDDTPGVSLTASASLMTAESNLSPADSGVTVSLFLRSQPTASVTIPVSLVAGGAYTAASEVALGASGFAGTVVDLVFTATSGQAVSLSAGHLSGGFDVAHVLTFTGVDDAYDDGDRTVDLTFGTISTVDVVYGNASSVPPPASVTITNRDNDTAALLVTPLNGLTTTEAGGLALFTVKLQAKPQADVTVSVASTLSSEGEVDQAQLIFTPSDYHIPQIVLVTGQDDDIADGNQAYQVVVGQTVTISGGTDAAYAAVASRTVSLTNLDNDSAGVVLTAINLALSEDTTASDHTATYSVRLSSQPTGTVTVSISAGSQATVSPSSLTFDSSSWSSTQSVTVTAIDDLVSEGSPHAGQVTHTVQSTDLTDAYASLSVSAVNLSIVDNDMADILVRDADGTGAVGTLSVTEAGTNGEFSLRLASKPTANVVVVLSSDDTTEGTVTPSSVAFDDTNWSTPKIVTVTGVDDRLHDGTIIWHAVTAAALSSDQGYNNRDPSDVTVQTTDDDSPGITTNVLGSLATSEAGGLAVFQVALACQPAAGTTVTLHAASGATTEITASADLVFTPSNWNTLRTVTLTGIDDALNDGDQSVSIIVGVATADAGRDTDFDAQSVTLSSINTDDDQPAILVSRTSGLVTTEAGDADSFTVRLSCQPTAAVTIPVSSSATSEGRVSYDSLVFTTTADQSLVVVGRTATAGWNVPITVTATGQDDVVVDGSAAWTVVLGMASSTDTDFLIDPSDVAVTNQDNETPITVTPASLTLTEGGAAGTITFALNGTLATGRTVTIPVTLDRYDQAQLTFTSVTFTAANAAQTQTIDVTAVDDGIDDGDAAVTVTIGAAISTDPVYQGYDAPDIPLTVVDKDEKGLRITPTTGLVTSETGSTATVTLRLGSRPTADVTVSLAGTSKIAISPASVTFTSSTWDQDQTFTLTGQDDFTHDGDVVVYLAVSVSSGDPEYDGLVVDPLQATNLDDDAPSILALPSAGSTAVAEGGNADDLQVRLTAQPTGTVTVTVVSDDQLSATPTTLTFTAATWNTAQQVLVRAIDDAVVEGTHTGTLILSATGGGYDGITASAVVVAIGDNDAAGILVSPIAGITTTEAGGNGAFTVSLRSRPTADVTIPVSSGNLAEVTVSTTLLTFTPATYATPQTVMVTGVDDAVDDGPVNVTIILGAASSADGHYAGIDPEDVTVVNQDDDQVAIVLSPAQGLLTDEHGTTAQVNIRLGSRPSATVTVGLTVDQSGEIALGTSSMFFTTSNWNTVQTLVLTGLPDGVQDTDRAFTITATAAGADTAYAGLTAIATGVNQDIDSPGVLVALPDGPLDLVEGTAGSQRLRLSLRTIPSHPVTVTLTNESGRVAYSSGEVTLSDTTPVDITVAAVDDDVAQGDQDLSIAIATASADGDYDRVVVAAVAVRVADDEVPGISVTPTEGLFTTEVGGTATFTVVLTAKPTASVTIGLTSSDTSQGTVSPTSLVFTPYQWSFPQTVTVTGVDVNGLEDGDVGYRIITAPAGTASNLDPYHGFDAADVLVVNRVVDNPPTIAQPADLAIVEDAGLQAVTVTGITSGQASESQSLVVTADSSDVTITGVVTTVYIDRAATAALSFTPPANANGTAAITVNVSDGTTTVSRTFAVVISPVNDLPEVTRNQPLTLGLRATGILRGAQPGVGDPNQLAATDVETASGNILFRVMLIPGGGTLTVAGVAVANDGSFTQDQLEAGLVAYTHAGGGGTNDGFTFKVEDGTGSSSPAVFKITIDRRAPDVQAAPTVPASLAFAENDGPLLLADQTTLSDSDNTTYNGAQMRVAFTAGYGTGDALTVVGKTTPQGELTVVAGSIRINDIAIATFTGGTGGNDLVITGATAATPIAFQALAQCLAYANASDTPTAGTRSITIQVTDPDLTATPVIALRPVVVTPVNDAPVLSAAMAITATNRATAGTVLVADPDGPAITMSVLTPPVKGGVSLNAQTGVFTYTPAAGLSGIDTFVVSGDDGLNVSSPCTVTVRITGSGAVARPWLVTDPPSEVQAGDLLRFTVAADVRELNGSASITFGVDDAPDGLVITQDTPTTAVITWTAVAGSSDYILFTLTATDATSGAMSVLPVTLLVHAAAGGGG